MTAVYGLEIVPNGFRVLANFSDMSPLIVQYVHLCAYEVKRALFI